MSEAGKPSQDSTRSEIAVVMRAEFDAAFARLPQQLARATRDFVVLRSAGERYAVALPQLSMIVADKAIVRVPSGCHEFLGLCEVRAHTLPVYDLRAMLGFAPAAHAGMFFVIASEPAVALAFEEFEGYLQVAPEGVVPIEAGANQTPHTRELVRDQTREQTTLAVIDLTSIHAAIVRLARDSERTRKLQHP